MRDRLSAAGTDTAALDARLLAEKAFDLTRLALATNENRPVTAAELATLDELAIRRLAGEPVARILGEKEFYGLSFVLNEATLVPRPETELLVDRALATLEGRAGARILDLGTGTGCIPISILASTADVTAVATDLSPRALEAARENARRLGMTERLVLLEGSWFEPLQSPSSGASRHLLPQGEKDRATTAAPGSEYGSARDRGWSTTPSPLVGEGAPKGRMRGVDGAEDARFDLIVSNPPYIESAEIPGLAPEVSDHDPRLALDGGPDGLAPYRVIAAQAPRYLKPGGFLMVEIGSRQGRAVAELFEKAGFESVAIDKDLAGLDRVVSGHHLEP